MAESVVEFAATEPWRTSDVPGTADRLMRLLPGLRGHRCDNGEGRTFAEELSDTELAHAFEHAALEVMALAGSPDTLRGETRWDFHADGRGVFRVRVAYDDDLVCLGALVLAERAVRAAVGGDEAHNLDVPQEVAALRALRRK